MPGFRHLILVVVRIAGHGPIVDDYDGPALFSKQRRGRGPDAAAAAVTMRVSAQTAWDVSL
jgi:hypothetical protein